MGALWTSSQSAPAPTLHPVAKNPIMALVERWNSSNLQFTNQWVMSLWAATCYQHIVVTLCFLFYLAATCSSDRHYCIKRIILIHASKQIHVFFPNETISLQLKKLVFDCRVSSTDLQPMLLFNAV